MVRLLPLGLALASFAAAAPVALAQDGPPAPAAAAAPDDEAGRDRPERLRLARERWDRMSPGERARVLRNFERWRALPQERRDEMRRRFEGLGGREGTALLRSQVEDASPERLARLRMQSDAVRRLEERLVEGLPSEAAERFAALPEEDRERWRRRFARRLLEAGREDLVRRHATEEERRALEGADPAARRAALAALLLRTREQVLAPHRDALDALPVPERRRREFVLMEERFREGVARRVEEERASFLKALLRPDGPKAEPPPNGRPRLEELRERFEREFGVRPEAVGARWARPLAHAARALPPDHREAFVARVRPELLRIAALPEGERDAAMRALLRSLRKP
jgi:hypothetical protein